MSRLLARGLIEEGHHVDTCGTSASADERFRAGTYDAVILDWSLPDEDGLTLLARWRDEGFTTPVIILSARGSPRERVLGLRKGADDYLVKPFSFDELVARLDALNRRAAALGAASSQLGDVLFSRTKRELACNGATASLTGREFQLFRYFADRPGEVCHRSELLTEVWGPAFDGDPNVVDVYVSALRTKLAQVATARLSIVTVRGSGYRLQVTREGDAP